MAFATDAAFFIALAGLLALGAWLRLRRPHDAVAVAGYRGGLWLMVAAGGSLLLRLAGIV